MCLTIKKDQQAEIAQEDIIVYKHLIDDGLGNYRTSFYYAEVQMGNIYTSSLVLDEDGEVNYGLHSYANEETAIEEAVCYWETVVQCTIPKGSTFYKGTFGSREAYASDTLIYNHEIISYPKLDN